MNKLTKKQKRMKEMVVYMKEYWETYDKQSDYLNYTDETFLHDAIYGLGVALNKNEYQWAEGYIKFKAFLARFLSK